MRLRQRPYWQRLLITAIAYGVVMVVDGVFTRGAVPPPSWFDAGVALAAVLLMGWEVLPVFFFMTLAGVLSDSWPLPVILTATAAVTIEPALGAWLLKRAKFRPTFESVRDIWLFISLGVVVGTMPAMLTGVVAVTIGWGAPYGPSYRCSRGGWPMRSAS